MIFKNAVFYFVALLLVLIGGFWKSYFSVLDSDISLAQHFHGISMLLWVLLLISQSWLVRRQNMKLHRATGKLSFVLAPLVVWSGLLVVLDNLAKRDDPFTQGALNILWFGIFLVLLFALLYGLAILYRKNMHLHARYMISTALVFLVPGLSRLFGALSRNLGVWMPDLYQTTMLAWAIGIVLLLMDRKAGQFRAPFAVFTVLWGIHLWLFKNIYMFEWWHDFARWYLSFA